MLRTRWGAFHVYDTCAWDDHLIPKHYIVAVTSSENVFNVQILIFTLKPEHEPCSGARTMPQGISSDEKSKNPPKKQLVSRYCSHHQVSEVLTGQIIRKFPQTFSLRAQKPSSLHCLQKAIFFRLYRLLDFLGVDMTIDHPHN